MGILTGLPGTIGGIVAPGFKTAAECIRILRHEANAACTAGENGAINVWRDSADNLRAHVQRFQATVEEAEFGEVGYKALATWLRPRLKQIRKPNAEAARQRREIVIGRIGPWERQK